MAQTSGMTRNQKSLFAKSSSYTFLLFWLFITVFPIFWMVSTSFKPPQEWFAWPPHWIPAEATVNNYEEILAIGPGGTGSEDSQLGGAQQVLTAILPVRDSLIVAIISSMIAVTLGSFLAYTISRYQTGGKRYPYILLMIRMMPPIVIAVPVLAYFTLPWWRGALHDNYLGLIIPYVLVTLPYAVWLMLSFMQDVPRELENAARMMGAGRMLVMRRVILPLIRPGLAVTFIFTFILNWSEFLLAYTLAGQKLVTVTVQLSQYEAADVGRLYGPQAAFGTIAIIPLIILGFAIQKHLVTGFSFGMVRK
jgi:multiple sugar transport system permease protein